VKLKKILMLSLIVGMSYASECQIMTSPINLNKMVFGDSSWYAVTIPIVEPKTYKYTSFVDAYDRFDRKARNVIKEVICKKNKWDGVVNYKVKWQQTKNTYIFVATFDAFAKK